LERVEHKLLLQWMVLAGLSVFTLAVARQSGFIDLMIATDSSKLCIAIMFIYAGGFLLTLRQAWALSVEQNVLGELHRRLLTGRDPHAGVEILPGGLRDLASGTLLPDGFATQHLRDVLLEGRDPASEGEGTGDLLNARAQLIRDNHDIDWFLIDIMMKLGFLGTVIGFIAMLGSVADTADIDVGLMQKVLRQMSYGMGTALYTTEAGLVGAILLGTKAYLLGLSMNSLVAESVKLARQVKSRQRAVQG